MPKVGKHVAGMSKILAVLTKMFEVDIEDYNNLAKVLQAMLWGPIAIAGFHYKIPPSGTSRGEWISSSCNLN